MDIKAVSPDLIHNPRKAKIAEPGVEPDARTRASARKVAQEFEAMFTGMIIKSMRSTTGSDTLTGGGRGEEVFRSLLDQEYAMAIAKQGSMGLGKSIEKQLLDDARRQTADAARRSTKVQP